MISNKLTALTKRVLTKVFRTAVKQGYDHKENITDIYSLLYKEAKKEFTEDNEYSLEAFLNECFIEACRRNRDSF